MGRYILKQGFSKPKEVLDYIESINNDFLSIYGRLPEAEFFYGEETLKIKKISKLNRYIAVYYKDDSLGKSEIELIKNIDSIKSQLLTK